MWCIPSGFWQLWHLTTVNLIWCIADLLHFLMYPFRHLCKEVRQESSSLPSPISLSLNIPPECLVFYTFILIKSTGNFRSVFLISSNFISDTITFMKPLLLTRATYHVFIIENQTSDSSSLFLILGELDQHSLPEKWIDTT